MILAIFQVVRPITVCEFQPVDEWKNFSYQP